MRKLFKDIPILKPALIASFSFVFGFVLSKHLLPINLSSAASNIDVQATTSSTLIAQTEKSIPEKTATVLTAETEPSASYVGAYYNSRATTLTNTAGANAAGANASSSLFIPSLGINSAITPSSLSGKELSVPSSNVGVYGTLYMGHSSGIFARLNQARVGQQLYLNGNAYTISSVEINQPVWSNRKGVGAHGMNQLIALGASQIVLMTCSGSYVEGFGWSGRTLVFASLN